MGKRENFINWVLNDLYKDTEFSIGEYLDYYLPPGVYLKNSSYNLFYEKIQMKYAIPTDEIFDTIEERYVNTLYDLQSDHTIWPSRFKSLKIDGSVYDYIQRYGNQLNESTDLRVRNTIKKILKEQVSGKERLRQMAIDALFKAYVVDTKRIMIDATLRDMNMFFQKARNILETTYGISRDKDSELFNDIINTWMSNVLGIPKIGSTIRVINMEDAQAPPPGTLGVVWGYNDTPWETQLSVNWENGSYLDVIPSVDEYEVLS